MALGWLGHLQINALNFKYTKRATVVFKAL